MTQIILSLTLFALLSTQTVYADPRPSRLEYARQCAQVMGKISAIDCTKGTEIRITKNKNVLESDNNENDCERPSQLGLGARTRHCVPGSRFLLIKDKTDPDVVTAIICRRYSDDKSKPRHIFDDIAVIQHNKKNGDTCFFQSDFKVEGHDGRNIPSPQEDSLSANKLWRDLAKLDKDDTKLCTNCHDSSPFIWSPYIGQVTHDMDDFKKWQNHEIVWNSNFQNLFGRPVKTFKPENNICTNCHRIGEKTCHRDDKGVTNITVQETLTNHWMPPVKSLYDPKTLEHDIEQIYACCENPENPKCNTK